MYFQFYSKIQYFHTVYGGHFWKWPTFEIFRWLTGFLKRASPEEHVCQRGSSKCAHAWISIIFCMLNNYVITTTKTKIFYSSKAVRSQEGTLIYTLFVLIYDLLNISLKSLTLLTATFFEWNMKEDFPGYTLLPLMYMNTSRYFFLTHQNLNYPILNT